MTTDTLIVKLPDGRTVKVNVPRVRVVHVTGENACNVEVDLSDPAAFAKLTADEACESCGSQTGEVWGESGVFWWHCFFCGADGPDRP